MIVTADGLHWVKDGPHTDDHLGPDPHEANLEPVIRGLLGHGVFLDVGAHVGRWALRMAGQAKKVIAVEANPYTAQTLNENIWLNQLEDQVTVLQVAAWDEEALFHLEDPNGKHRGGSTYVVRDDEGQVRGRPLDSLLGDEPEIGLIKLDVEGADIHALNGLRRTIERCRPRLFIERHDCYGYYKIEDMYELLSSMRLEWQDGPRYGEGQYLIVVPEEVQSW